MQELKFSGVTRKGSQGDAVKRAQEWLCLHGHGVVVDGSFGPATERAVLGFQEKQTLTVSGVVEEETFSRMVEPLRSACEAKVKARKLGTAAVELAKLHAGLRPREVGGENSGPWVRLYLDGKEGPEWPWCAGFATYVLRQAAGSLGVPMPVARTFSCDVLGAQAERKGRLLRQPPPEERKTIVPGSLFLVAKTATDWVHVGLVTRAAAEWFETVEGNTNDDGSREGFEVCARTRGYEAKDFILL